MPPESVAAWWRTATVRALLASPVGLWRCCSTAMWGALSRR